MLKAFISVNNKQSRMEALCLRLISPLLYSIKLACIQVGMNSLTKAIG